jgi:hypothetical protein
MGHGVMGAQLCHLPARPEEKCGEDLAGRSSALSWIRTEGTLTRIWGPSVLRLPVHLVPYPPHSPHPSFVPAFLLLRLRFEV